MFNLIKKGTNKQFPLEPFPETPTAFPPRKRERRPEKIISYVQEAWELLTFLNKLQYMVPSTYLRNIMYRSYKTFSYPRSFSVKSKYLVYLAV